MSADDEVVDTKACVAAIISAYRDCASIAGLLEAKEAEDQAPSSSDEFQESIDQALVIIKRAVQSGVAVYGDNFEEGDDVAIIALQRVAMQLQSSILRTLQNTLLGGDGASKMASLVGLVDSFRDKTVHILQHLGERLWQSESPSNAANGTLTNGLSSRNERHERTRLSMRSSTESSPVRATPPTYRRTWTPENGTSRDEEDADTGAGDGRGRWRRRRHHTTSLLGLLKHHRNKSGSKDISANVSGHASASPTNTPSGAGTPQRSKDRNVS